MKKNKLRFLAVFAILITAFNFTSCDNEPLDSDIDTDNPGPGSTTPVFKATFNGQTYSTPNVLAQVNADGISLVAIKSSGESFAFDISGTTIGTYQANANLLAYVPFASSEYGYWSIDPSSEITDTGSITITSINTTNHTISGTFNFTGYWTDFTDDTPPAPIVFTNGVFTNIPYTGEIENPNPGDEDTFFAKVDGTDFVEDVIDVAIVSSEGFPDRISIVGSKESGERIGLLIDQALPVGTYPITGPLSEDVVSGSYFNMGLQTAQTGSVTITSKTATRIAGTFQFSSSNSDGTNTAEITAGTFDVEYDF